MQPFWNHLAAGATRALHLGRAAADPVIAPAYGRVLSCVFEDAGTQVETVFRRKHRSDSIRGQANQPTTKRETMKLMFISPWEAWHVIEVNPRFRDPAICNICCEPRQMV